MTTRDPLLLDNIQQISQATIEIENVPEESSLEPKGGASLEDAESSEESVVVKNFPVNCALTNSGQVQCSQSGKILALVFEPPTDPDGNLQLPISPEHFPELLTGDNDLGFAPELKNQKNSSYANPLRSHQSVNVSFKKSVLDLQENR